MARRLVFAVILLMLVVGLFVQPAPVKAASPALEGFEPTHDTLYVPGEVVVGFEKDLASSAVQNKAAALAGEVSAMVVDVMPGAALLSFAEDADVPALVTELAGRPGVTYTEPNYISWIPEVNPVGAMYVQQEVERTGPNGQKVKLSINDLRSMRRVVKSGGRTMGIPTYANDTWNNWGFAAVNANIIWTNTAASPAVCVVDTGVDGAHPDLAGKVTNGWDFVNNDAIPNDDNGHGTHVSGVIAAKNNNGQGPAGISNGKVLAVKVLSAQGWGTDFDISKGILYCANNTSVKVISMSLGGPSSTSEYIALEYAILTKGKLVIASAGNSSTNSRSYPAGWADSITIGYGLLSVGASTNGPTWVDTNGDDSPTDDEIFNNCAANFSNYGDWVEMVAPGVSIYSSTPVSYPFWDNYFGDATTPYDSWDGTSMAAPHVSAGAARTWSVFPTETNAQIHNRLMNRGWSLNIQEDEDLPDSYGGDMPFCWPISMASSSFLNVSGAMDRAAISSWGTDAISGLPLTGATFQAVTTTGSVKDTAKLDTNTSRWFDLINLPISFDYHVQVSKSGYTSGYQKFWYYVGVNPYGWTTLPGIGVPPNTNFNVVADWWGETNTDLNLYVQLPYGSPSGMVGDGYSGHPDDMGVGTLLDFPQARWNREGGNSIYGDWLESESITINKKSSFPYYTGTYDVYLKDWDPFSNDLNQAYPVIRIWYGGAIKAAWTLNSTCGADDDWWHAGWFYKPMTGSSTAYWEHDGDTLSGPECGTGGVYDEVTNPGGVWWYALGQTISSVNH